MPAKSKKTASPSKEEKSSAKAARAKKPSAEKVVKKSKTSVVSSKKKKPEGLAIVKTGAAKRIASEEGSIAPPSAHLVSAFDMLRRKTSASTHAPNVTRLAPGSGFKVAPIVPRERVSGQAVASPNSISPSAGAGSALKPAAPSSPQKSSAPTHASPSPKTAPAPQPKIQSSVATPAAPTAPVAKPPTQPTPAKHPVKIVAPAEKTQTVKPSVQAPIITVSHSAPTPIKPTLKILEVPSIITVRELAEKMAVGPNEVIKKLMALGIFATINQRLEIDAASIIAQEFGHEIKVTAMYKEEEIETSRSQKESPDKLKSRWPIITVMGHVDHGKTSLLDAIRSSDVATGEAGGITQHIGAYKVSTSKGTLVFLDTPGHEAFTAMRSRGAKVTDIVVLVVSAVDGVMPQTIEAIDHAKAAGVPVVVAVNKIDLPTANPQKMRQELSQHGLNPEEWGGKTIFVDVSAKKRLNLDRLLEMISLQAELLDLKSNPDRAASGVVLEAKMDPQRGSVATLLVQSGTLKVGDALVVGLCYGKVKALVDDHGNRIQEAPPSTPVEILGLSKTPEAGDVFSVVSNEKESREIAEQRQRLNREQVLAHQRHVSLISLKSRIGSQAKDLNIILKADVQGSLQALRDSLEGLSTKECQVRIVHAGLGSANESDVLLASASNAIILLFNSDSESRARELASREEVEIRSYDIIYDLIADVKAGLEGLLAPEIVDVTIGKAEVREIFPVKGKATVAGCFIREGKASRGALARILRNGISVGEGKIVGLKRFKDDVKEVEKNLECGIQIEGTVSYQKGDALEIFIKESRVRRLAQAKSE